MTSHRVYRNLVHLFVLAAIVATGYGRLAAQTPSWMSMTPLPTPRFGAVAGVIDGHLHVVGGQANPPPTFPVPGLDRHDMFDPANGTWVAKAPPLSRRSYASAGVIGRKLYVTGGCLESDCRVGTTGALEVYDPDSNTWTSLAPMPTPRSSAASAVIGGKLYVAGGRGPCPPCPMEQSLQIYDPVTNTWDTTRASLPLAQSDAAGVSLNNRLYVIGGYDGAGQVLGMVQVYDPSTDTWSFGTPMPTPRPAMAAVFNGLIYAAGGASATAILATVESYDPVGDVWKTEPAMPTARARGVAGVVSGRLHVVTGLVDALSTTTGAHEAHPYVALPPPQPPPPPAPVLVSISVSPASKTLSPGQNQTFQAIGHYSDGTTKILPNGSGGGGGGTGPGRPLWSTQFSPQIDVSACAATPPPTPMKFTSQVFADVNGVVNETWTPMTPILDVDGTINAVSVSLTLACTNGAATGSISAQWTGTSYEGTFSFNGSNGAVEITGWSRQAPLPEPRFSLSAAAANGAVYVMGGGNPSLPSTVYAYSPSTNSWAPAGQMATPREGAGAATVNGRIYVVGGNVAGGTASGLIEAYDPVSQSWITGLSPMPTPRAHLAVVSDGVYVYALGGDTTGNNSGIVAKAERYDPATNTWTTLASMPAASSFFGAGVLNGKIVAVGTGANGGTSNSVHIYNIGSNTWTSGPSMPGARSMMAVGVANGGLYVVGGNGQSPYDTWVYAPATNMRPDGWAMAGSMPTSRAQLAAAVVDDVVYAIGGMLPGSNPTQALAANEALSTHSADLFAVGFSSPGGGGSNPLPSVQWQSTNTTVATVDGSGNAHANVPGQATIVATASNGMSCTTTNTCGALTVVDNQPPFLNVPNNAIREATGPSGAIVTWFASAFDSVDGQRPVTCNPPSGSQFPLGDTTVTCSASDLSGNTTTKNFVVTVRDTKPPFLSGPGNITRQATSPSGAVVVYSVTVFDTVDGQRPVTCNPPSGSTFPIGTTTVSCTASDTRGNSITRTFTVTVVDTTAPTIHSITPSQSVLWAPNHRMAPISIGVNVTDNGDSAPVCSITGVSSNEAVGATAPDWDVTGDLTVNLRAERDGNGSGRVYTIGIKCADRFGNTSTAQTFVTVPVDQRR